MGIQSPFFADQGPDSVGLYGFVTKTLELPLRKRLHKTYQNLQQAEKQIVLLHFLLDRSDAVLRTLQVLVGASLLAKAGGGKVSAS
ncbi:hypothetical protein ACIOVC_15680 [Pseudomonas neuropathica]